MPYWNYAPTNLKPKRNSGHDAFKAAKAIREEKDEIHHASKP
jgi:hypothetical protein